MPFGSSFEVIFISPARLAALLGDRPAGIVPHHPTVTLHVAHVIALQLWVAAAQGIITLRIEEGDKLGNPVAPEYTLLVAVLPYPRVVVMRKVRPLADDKLASLGQPLEGLILPTGGNAGLIFSFYRHLWPTVP